MTRVSCPCRFRILSLFFSIFTEHQQLIMGLKREHKEALESLNVSQVLTVFFLHFFFFKFNCVFSCIKQTSKFGTPSFYLFVRKLLHFSIQGDYIMFELISLQASYFEYYRSVGFPVFFLIYSPTFCASLFLCTTNKQSHTIVVINLYQLHVS